MQVAETIETEILNDDLLICPVNKRCWKMLDIVEKTMFSNILSDYCFEKVTDPYWIPRLRNPLRFGHLFNVSLFWRQSYEDSENKPFPNPVSITR